MERPVHCLGPKCARAEGDIDDMGYCLCGNDGCVPCRAADEWLAEALEAAFREEE